jgi:ATP-dependent protease Clp ATPase subunit
MDKIDWTSPQIVKAYLDTKAQWNELYKQSLSLMFWKLKRKIDTWNDKIKIPNLLVLGPSWWWKTYLLKLLAPLLWIPFAETNVATVESNYPNEKIWDVFDKIWKSVNVAIVFIDEVDKILMNPRHPLNNELMSYIEWWTYEWRSLKDFVFVWAWAFQWHNSVIDEDWNVNLKALQDIWVKPEVLWRFWNICGIEKMNTEKMMAILKAENSVFNQRVKSIQDEYWIWVELEEGVLEYICEIAIKQPTWARALDLITNVLFTGFEFNIWEYLVAWEIKLDMENTKNLLESLNY